MASEHRLKIILDDRQARGVARRLGLVVMGTIGCLLKAKQAGIISEVRPLIEKLEGEEFYFSEALKEEALLGWRVALSGEWLARKVDGAPAARYLQAILRYIETPYLLLA